MYFTLEVTCSMVSSGWRSSIFSTSARTFSETLTSLASRERRKLKVTASWPL
ncbi:hypothetical protein D3C77_193250 [compost metagenome]